MKKILIGIAIISIIAMGSNAAAYRYDIEYFELDMGLNYITPSFNSSIRDWYVHDGSISYWWMFKVAVDMGLIGPMFVTGEERMVNNLINGMNYTLVVYYPGIVCFMHNNY